MLQQPLLLIRLLNDTHSLMRGSPPIETVLHFQPGIDPVDAAFGSLFVGELLLAVSSTSIPHQG